MHYPLLNIYRYFAALIVCISHFIFNWNKSIYFEFTSILGVELFFILSGFVLAPQILKVEKNPHLAAFIASIAAGQSVEKFANSENVKRDFLLKALTIPFKHCLKFSILPK